MKRIFYALVLVFCLVLGSRSGLAQEVNQPAPDFTLNDTAGAQVSLSNYQNKKAVLIVFWTTWCPFCVQEIPELNTMMAKDADKVQILAVNVQEDPQKIAGFIQKKRIQYPILLDPEGLVAQQYQVIGIPLNVLVNKEGKIIYKGHSLNEAEEILEQIYS